MRVVEFNSLGRRDNAIARRRWHCFPRDRVRLRPGRI